MIKHNGRTAGRRWKENERKEEDLGKEKGDEKGGVGRVQTSKGCERELS